MEHDKLEEEEKITCCLINRSFKGRTAAWESQVLGNFPLSLQEGRGSLRLQQHFGLCKALDEDPLVIVTELQGCMLDIKYKLRPS